MSFHNRHGNQYLPPKPKGPLPPEVVHAPEKREVLQTSGRVVEGSLRVEIKGPDGKVVMVNITLPAGE